MAEKKTIELEVKSNIEGSISELKALKRQLKDTAAGSAEFKQIYNQIDDLEDKIKSAKNTSSDWVDSLENAGGPLGMVGAAINKAKVATQSFGGALKATGIGLIVSLLAGLAAAFSENEGAMKKIQPLLNGLQKLFQGVFRVVEPLFNTLVDLAIDALPMVSKAFEVVYSSITAVFKSLGSLGSALNKLIHGDFKGAWESAKESVNGFSKNYNKSVENFQKGTKEMTKTEKEESDKRAEARKKAQEEQAEKDRLAREKKLADEKAANQKLLEAQKAYQDELLKAQQDMNLQRVQQSIQDNLDAQQSQEDRFSDITSMVERLEGQNQESNDRQVASDKAAAQAKKDINNLTIQSASGLVGILMMLGEKNKGLQKAGLIANSALSIAEIINNTNVGSSKEVATKGIFGLSTSAILYAKMGISIASVLAATAKGLSGIGGSGGGSVPNGNTGNNGGSVAPQFNVVGASSTNQLAQTIGKQQNQPLKAYVVSSEVTTQQSLDRNIVSTATL
jgi:hypothetical protein